MPSSRPTASRHVTAACEWAVPRVSRLSERRVMSTRSSSGESGPCRAARGRPRIVAHARRVAAFGRVERIFDADHAHDELGQGDEAPAEVVAMLRFVPFDGERIAVANFANARERFAATRRSSWMSSHSRRFWRVMRISSSLRSRAREPAVRNLNLMPCPERLACHFSRACGAVRASAPRVRRRHRA